MNVTIQPRRFDAVVRVPASKSHTIRQLLIASLADGVSHIRYPLESLDTASCVHICSELGADIQEERDGSRRLLAYTVRGTASGAAFRYPAAPLDTGNSGTTLFFALAAAALGRKTVPFTGDEQLRRRSAAALLDALRQYGVCVASNDGCAPLSVCGPWKGGRASIACPTSQYLSAVLIAAPLAPEGCLTEIDVPLLYEKPYIEMTLKYLRELLINQGTGLVHNEDFSYFSIPGGAAYRSFSHAVPADFSSAAFPALAAVVSGGSVTLAGLDPGDTQGDKAFFSILEAMGAAVQWRKDADNSGWLVDVAAGTLRGGVFDLNDTPDLFPAACVLGAYAAGETALVNVENARIKETDRIAVMAASLTKAGISCEERPDGIVIQGGSRFAGGRFDGFGDHRVVMALCCAALGASGPCEITGAEAADVTYPGFVALTAPPPGAAFP